ncbi:hemicentin-2-like isoform X2 [Vanessa cardui]|uniref:hemicentin-2-like isoform X2 n=1 Tax=Vanessa cardui TaxID=171605 RepID=UPI001F143C0E|nr:hemicentin-2-like isoform X2 [Vanessa cardui]
MSANLLFISFVFLIFVNKSQQYEVVPSDNNLKANLTDKDYGKGSLVFVFDTTGSMFNDLRQLREGAEMILKTALEDSNVIADFVFVPFHDPAVGPPTVTKNKDIFKSALNIVRVYGGGDCPEKSLTGIQMALKVSRPRSFIYVFTDATASDHRKVGSVLDSIQRKQSQVVFVLTGHCNDLNRPSYKVYQQIAAASSGQVFNLNKTSVHKVLEFVRSSIKGRTVNLGSAFNPAGYNYTQKIPVDRSVGEVTVSVSGAKPQIKVVNPSGEEITGPPQLVTTLDLSEIMIVKVLQPEPGNWSITVGSEEEHSVKVVGLSNLTFQHGFSIKPTTSLEETSYRPLQDAYNHMMIALSESNTSLQLDNVQLLGLDGNTIFEVPLKSLNGSDGRTYVADAFVPPNDFFNLAIIGHDESGQEVRRVGPTAVQAKPPDVPELIVPKKVRARTHERVRLSCRSHSAVPQSVGWSRAAPVSALQSVTAEYVIEDMSEGDVGVYYCVARNVAGRSTASTVVDLIVDAPRVNISSENVSLSEHENLTISCHIFSEALLQRTQIVFNGTLQSYVKDIKLEPSMDGYYTFNKTIRNLSERDSGVYTCVAVNRAGYTNDSTNIIIQLEPIAQILGPHSITKRAHSDVQFVCHVENALQVLWSHNNATVKKYDINGSYNAVLDVKNVTDDGIWTCVALRDSYSASDTIALTVLMKPEVIIEGSKNITILNGTTIQLSCTVVAKPAPRIVWHMETERFLPNVVTNPEPKVYKSVLTLDSRKEPVNGTYFCFGENSEGINQDSVTIEVRRQMTVIKGFTDTSVEIYSQTNFTCDIDAYPPPHITWYHNNTRIDNNERISISDDNTIISIHRVDFVDLGRYVCQADNGFENMSVVGTLAVHGLAKPLILKEPSEIVTQQSKMATLKCRLTKGNPEPRITWQFKDDSSDFFSLPDGVSIKDHKYVIISEVQKYHAGKYRCTAENIMGTDLYDVDLIVQYPPEFNVSQENHLQGPIEVKSGNAVQLSCNVSGVPPPIVTWTKDELPVIYSSHVYLNNDSVLVLANATTYDSGVFRCNASSALGFVTKDFNITVYMPPEIARAETTVSVREGELVWLRCAARGAPPPAVRWTRAPPASRALRGVDGLRFVANVTDFGEYTCIASNPYGTASLNYTVYVWVPPHIEPPVDVFKEVQIGSDLHIACDAVGFPLPEITWEFQEETLIDNMTYLSFDEYGNLYLKNASSIHEGLYVCIAENLAGIAKKNYFVAVIEKPEILVDNYTGPYVASDLDVALTISCRTAGKPRPYVSWIKDGYYLDRDSRYDIDADGTLTIKSPSEDLSGIYTCVATNGAGNDTKDVTVEIYSLPTVMQDESAVSTVTALEGSAVELQCPVTHGHTVKWYKDAELISAGGLMFANVSRAHAAQYACVSANAVGSAHAHVQLRVQWPPAPLAPSASAPQAMRALEGSDHYFHCQTDAEPRALMKWLFNSKPIFGEDEDVLKILNVQLRHRGEYECVARNEHGAFHRRFSFEVLKRPFISEFDLLEVQLKSGVNASLECVAKGSPKPTISWTFNNTNWIIENTTLKSSNVTQQSEGLFRCDATNEAGVAHLVYRVFVVMGARVDSVVLYVNGEGTRVEDNVEISLDTKARIACKAAGSPSPIIQWIRHGNTISQNSEGIDYADLKFDRVSTSDNGEYTCIASNEGGLQEKKIKVNVLDPPRIFQTLFQNANHSKNEINLEAIIGQAFYMHCHPYGNPLPDIYWFKDGLPLRFYDDTMVSTDFGEIVISKRAKQEQSGNYTCVARNKVGESSVVYLVDILVPPPIPKDNIKHASVFINATLNLTCPAEGRPRPYVMWVKHPYIEITESQRLQLQDDNYTLIIKDTEVADSGKYSCIMTNKVGATELVYDVVIQKAPTIIGNDGNSTVEEHVVDLRKSIVLKCEVDGNPPPKITWYKRLSDHQSNVQHVQGSSLLALWSARAADAGPYVCVAESSAGAAHRRHYLRVRVPGKWSSWSQWSYCNVTCGLGYQHRARRCQYIDDENNVIDKISQPDKIVLDESACRGLTNDRRKCHMPSCEEEDTPARWSNWSRWSSCSASCGVGTQTRTRRCRSEEPCIGDNVQIRKCPGLPKCRVNREKDTDFHGSGENIEEINPDYMPEATFEMDPDPVPQPERYDDFYIPPETPHRSYYDVNVTENLDQSEQGPCEPGYMYTSENETCEDIDECLFNINHCHPTQVCANLPGGYRCSCPPGYYSLGAGQRCLDVNECAQDTHACEFACVNAAGGYVCACPAHLRLHRDRHHCVPPSSFRKPYFYEDENGDGNLSASFEHPSRKRRH